MSNVVAPYGPVDGRVCGGKIVPYDVAAAVPGAGTGTTVVGAGRCGPTTRRTIPVPAPPVDSVNVPYDNAAACCGVSRGNGGGKHCTCVVGTGAVVVGAGRCGPTTGDAAPVPTTPWAPALPAAACMDFWDSIARKGGRRDTLRATHKARCTRWALTERTHAADMLRNCC